MQTPNKTFSQLIKPIYDPPSFLVGFLTGAAVAMFAFLIAMHATRNNNDRPASPSVSAVATESSRLDTVTTTAVVPTEDEVNRVNAEFDRTMKQLQVRVDEVAADAHALHAQTHDLLERSRRRNADAH